MRKKEQGWREETDAGEIRECMGVREKSGWRIQSRMKGEEEWVHHDRPFIKDVEKLVELLNLKYRRTKGSLKEVEVARKLLAKAVPKRD
jgi:hypothetical protein